MSDDIVIGSAQAGSMAIGGSGNVIHSGHLEIHSLPASDVAELRALLSSLQKLAAQNGAPQQVQASVTAAVNEAAQEAPDTSRLRTLMAAVRSGVGKAGPLAQLAANIITFIGGIENIVH